MQGLGFRGSGVWGFRALEFKAPGLCKTGSGIRRGSMGFRILSSGLKV